MYQHEREKGASHEHDEELSNLRLPEDLEEHRFHIERISSQHLQDEEPSVQVRLERGTHDPLDQKIAPITAFVLAALASVSFEVNKPVVMDLLARGRSALEHTVKEKEIAPSPQKLNLAGLTLSDIAKEEKLQSLIIRDLSTGEIAHVRGTASPIHTASTLKLVIARAVIERVKKDPSFTLDTVLPPVTEEVRATDDGELGRRFSVKEALTLMLKDSHNTASNVLVRSLGGRGEAFEKRAKEVGCSSCKFPNYYSTSGGRVNGAPQANLVDLSAAMASIFADQSEAAKIAQRALIASEKDFTYPHQRAHKIGENSKVLGDIGLVEIGGRRFVIGGFVETRSVAEKAREGAINRAFSKMLTKVEKLIPSTK